MKNKKKERSSPAGQKRAASAGSAGPANPATHARLSPAKLWFFRFAALFLVPLIVLAAAELILRFAGFGYPTTFFKRIEIGNTACLAENDKFGLRFFPSSVARSPAPTVISAKKAPGMCRIFVLGESAALGDPRPAFGAPRYLEALLQERYPDRKFEVVTAAMTAINSHALVDIAHECAGREGDFWIVYMGNNEMVGPYGAATVFGAQAPPRMLVKLSLAAQKLRFGQLLAQLAEKIRSKPNQSWGGMEMFLNSRVPPADRKKTIVYETFKKNLAEILQTGLSSGARVLVSSVAVNLRDCPPFASISRTNLSAQEQATFAKLLTDATSASTNGDFASAASSLEQAAVLDPSAAELQYDCGSVLLKAGNVAAARQHYQNACDSDALPFRADSKINGTISADAARALRGSSKLVFFDAVRLFDSLSEGQVPGKESFYEHVHLNFDGNYRLARGWAEALDPWLAGLAGEQRPREWASQQICERRLGLTDWNRVGVLDDIVLRLGRPPFAAQRGNSQRLAGWQAVIAQLKKGMDTNSAQAARQVYADALKDRESDFLLHENFAEFLEAVGDLDAAIAQWQTVAQLTPHHHLGYYHSGRLLAEHRKLPEARAWLTKAVTRRPDLEDGWFELGKVDLAESKFELSLQDLEKARLLLPQDFRVYYHEGKALSKLSRRAEAIQKFRETVQLRPGYWQARYSLGEELAFDGQNDAAIEQFREVLKLRPDHSMTHLNLGVGLYKAGRRQEAREQFSEAVRFDPQNRTAAEYLKHLEKPSP